MDTVRIGFFLGKLSELSWCACDIGNAFLYGKTKEKVYVTADPKFGAYSHGKHLIIDKSLTAKKKDISTLFKSKVSGGMEWYQ
jgi:hypothetical protein